MSELLFSYGTLRQREVQLATFGRELDGYVDAVIGYDLDYVTITDPHVIATSGSDRHPILRPDEPAGRPRRRDRLRHQQRPNWPQPTPTRSTTTAGFPCRCGRARGPGSTYSPVSVHRPRTGRTRYERSMVEEPQPASDGGPAPGISRRRLLTTGAATTIVGAGLGAGAVAFCSRSPGHGPSSVDPARARAGRNRWVACICSSASDASTEVVVSWHTTDPVHNPRVMVGHADRQVSAALCRPRPAPTVTRNRKPKFGSITRGSTISRPTPTTCTPRCTTAPTPSLAPSGPLRRDEGHCASPASAIRRPRHWAKAAQDHLWQRQLWIPGGRRHHDRDRTNRSAVQLGQRRPVLRQPGP